MHWFLASLIAPLVWSIINHVDKLILSRYFHGGGSGGLMIFVGVVAVPLAFAIAFFEPTVLSISAQSAWSLIASGLLYNLGIFWYLKALERSDASYIVPFWQLIPVFTYIFGVLLLAEHLATERLLGGAIVIIGSIVLATTVRLRRIEFDTRTVVIMVASSAAMALGYVLFKDGADVPFWTSMFWNQIGMILFAGAFVSVRTFRREFIDVVQTNSKGVLALNLGEQIFEIFGVVASNFAILLAPAAVIILVEYTAQPIFVFLFGVLLTIMAPSLVREDISTTSVIRKLVAIAIMSIGLYLVVR